jgi:hypothetical protein
MARSAKLRVKGEDRTLTSSIPSAEEVYTAREKAGFEQTKNHAEGGELVPLFGEAHADHDDSPEEGDAGKVDAWAEPAHQDGGGRLEGDIGGEKDQDNHRLKLQDRD